MKALSNFDVVIDCYSARIDFACVTAVQIKPRNHGFLQVDAFGNRAVPEGNREGKVRIPQLKGTSDSRTESRSPPGSNRRKASGSTKIHLISSARTSRSWVHSAALLGSLEGSLIVELTPQTAKSPVRPMFLTS